jgi:hypothetical protein
MHIAMRAASFYNRNRLDLCQFSPRDIAPGTPAI